MDRFAGHAVSPETAADKILAGVRRNRYLIYTSPDIRALYAFKRVAWWPYSVAMRQVNVVVHPSAAPQTPARRSALAPVPRRRGQHRLARDAGLAPLLVQFDSSDPRSAELLDAGPPNG